MTSNSIMDRIRMFFGFHQEPPANDFRNPIWGSDDDDDGDELYTRQQIVSHEDIHRELEHQMRDMFTIFKSFGNMFGEMKSFIEDDHLDSFVPAIADVPSGAENFDSNSLRDHYLKPSFHMDQPEPPQDIDLDGKISSNEISGLLKKKDGGDKKIPTDHFNGKLVPGKSFCQTIITTSVKKSDGTTETRRIIKNGHEVVEETTTTTVPTSGGPTDGNPMLGSPTGLYTAVMSEALTSLFRNFY